MSADGDATHIQDTTMTFSGADLSAMALDESRSRLYITDSAQNRLHVLNTASLKIESTDLALAGTPGDMEITADDTLLLVTVSTGDGGRIREVDLEGGRLGGVIDLGTDEPTSLVVDDRNQVFVGVRTENGIRSVRVFAKAGGQWQEQAQLPATAKHVLGRSPDRSRIFTSDLSPTPLVIGWDVSTAPVEAVSSRVLFGDVASSPGRIVPGPAGSTEFYLINHDPLNREVGTGFDGGTLPRYETHTLTPLGSVRVDYQPIAVAVTADGKRLAVAHSDYVVNASSTGHDPNRADIHVFDTATLVQLAYISLPGPIRYNGLRIDSDYRVYAIQAGDPATDLVVLRR